MVVVAFVIAIAGMLVAQPASPPPGEAAQPTARGERVKQWADVQRVNSAIAAMSWREWNVKTTWDPKVEAKGWWRMVGHTYEIAVEVVPIASAETINNMLGNPDARLIIDLPEPLASAKLRTTVPKSMMPATIGTASYRSTSDPACLGGINLVDNFSQIYLKGRPIPGAPEFYSNLEHHVLVPVWYEAVENRTSVEATVDLNDIVGQHRRPIGSFFGRDVSFYFHGEILAVTPDNASPGGG